MVSFQPDMFPFKRLLVQHDRQPLLTFFHRNPPAGAGESVNRRKRCLDLEPFTRQDVRLRVSGGDQYNVDIWGQRRSTPGSAIVQWWITGYWYLCRKAFSGDSSVPRCLKWEARSVEDIGLWLRRMFEGLDEPARKICAVWRLSGKKDMHR